jgi:hypothetical protein
MRQSIGWGKEDGSAVLSVLNFEENARKVMPLLQKYKNS